MSESVHKYRAPWPIEHWNLALEMAGDGADRVMIAKALRKSPWAIKNKFDREGRTPPPLPKGTRSAPIECGDREKGAALTETSRRLIAEAERRRALPISLTARFCGDPLPGLSALDQKRNSESQSSRVSVKPRSLKQ